ncbi:MAG: hypothetical protein IPO56_00110 [Flavobacteriales bacterium]|nr:hypothetical protein [Flavobacteriales bacterium]
MWSGFLVFETFTYFFRFFFTSTALFAYTMLMSKRRARPIGWRLFSGTDQEQHLVLPSAASKAL